MRQIAALLCVSASLALFPIPSHAADTVGLEAFVEPAAGQADEKDAKDAAAIDWVAVESTGTLSSAKSGALEKTLWQGQKRSEIESHLEKLPERQKLRSALNLQRRLLLSKSNAALIDNDVPPARGNDLLIQRIEKLMQMGLYDDAWSLYTEKAENPYDASIAEIGMLLLVIKNDLPTACLEEKVLASRYPGNGFFSTLDRACSGTLGIATPDFKDNAVLQAIYTNPSYTVPASNPDRFVKMGELDRALVLANGRIRYDGLTPEILAKTPSSVVALYLMDRSLSEPVKAMIKAETDRRGLSWHIASVARDPTWQKAKNLGKDITAQWPILEQALAEEKNPGDLGPYIDMLSNAKPENLSTESLTKVLGGFLAASRPLPSFWAAEAQKRKTEKPIINIYLKAFSEFTPALVNAVDDQAVDAAIASLNEKDRELIAAIMEILDKDVAVFNNPARIYEKQTGLTLENNYVMPTSELDDILKNGSEKKQIGITVLAVLNALATLPDNMYSETVRKSLYGLLNVGLLEDARLVGSDITASVLNKY